MQFLILPQTYIHDVSILIEKLITIIYNITIITIKYILMIQQIFIRKN